MIPEALYEVLKHEGVVAIATHGQDGVHMANTWNSYVEISPEGRLLMPVGGMSKTEANVAHDPHVLITLGSRGVKGLRGDGTGFLIKGRAEFVTSGHDYESMHAKFFWLRAVLAVMPEEITQTL